MPTQADIITAAMEHTGTNTSQLAKAIGKSKQYTGRVVKGETPLTKPETITAVADRLDIDEDDLYLALDRIPPDIIATIKNNPRIIKRIRETYHLG